MFKIIFYTVEESPMEPIRVVTQSLEWALLTGQTGMKMEAPIRQFLTLSFLWNAARKRVNFLNILKTMYLSLIYNSD